MKALQIRTAASASAVSKSSRPVASVPFRHSVVAPKIHHVAHSERRVEARFFKIGGASNPNEYVQVTGRDSFTQVDVEDYFNYMGCLAAEGSYDRMDALLASGLAFIDILLILAATENDTPKVREVLGAGADVRVKDCSGKTALQLATKPEVVDMLKAAEAKLAASA